MTASPTWTEIEAAWIAPDQASQFVEGYTTHSGLEMSTAIVRGDRTTRGFFQRGQMVGGYRVCTGGQRYGALVGADAMARWPFDLEDTVEITYLWMKPDLPNATRRTLYGWMVADVMATRRTIVLGGTVDPVIARQQMRSMPNVLEDCPIEILGRQRRLRIYYGTVVSMLADAAATGVPLPWLGMR